MHLLVVHSPPKILIPLWGNGRAENRPELWYSAVHTAGTTPTSGGVIRLPTVWPPAKGRSGLASAEEYPEEYLDSCSPSLGEEEHGQIKGGLRAQWQVVRWTACMGPGDL